MQRKKELQRAGSRGVGASWCAVVGSGSSCAVKLSGLDGLVLHILSRKA